MEEVKNEVSRSIKKVLERTKTAAKKKTTKITRVFTLTLLIVLVFAFFVSSNIIKFPAPVKASDTLIDSYDTANRDQYFDIKDKEPLANGYNTAYSQSFTASFTGTVTSAKFYMQSVGSPTGNLKYALFEDSGEYGTSSVPGASLQNSSVLDVSTIAVSWTLYELTFPTPPEITSGAKYSLAVGFIPSGTIDNSNYIQVGMDDSTPSHSGNSAIDFNGGWTASGADIVFEVYGVESGGEDNFNWMGGDYSGYYNSTAASGSVTDVQAAVADVVANGDFPSAGCGNVFIPSGNHTFNLFDGSWDGVRWTGVTIPGGVNVFGTGQNDTILFTGTSNWRSDGSALYGDRQFYLDGENNKPIRIAGIFFQGSINFTVGAREDSNLGAIHEHGVTDFRIDHNIFNDFTGNAIFCESSYYYGVGNCGVIDHNEIDNPYKEIFWNETATYPLWAYGIIVNGPGWATSSWRTYDEIFGQYDTEIIYIEDNYFRRCRHCIAESGQGSDAYYVARFNVFTDNVPEHYASFIDAHPGGRGFEAYNNTFIDVESDYRSIEEENWGVFYNRATTSDSGSGLFYNNTVLYCASGVNLRTVQTSNETWRVNGWWIWDNTFTEVADEVLVSSGSPPFDIVLNDEYYLRAPTLEDDGFNYEPYAYPHPLAEALSGEEQTGYYYLTVTAPVGSGSVLPVEGEYIKNVGYNQSLVATAGFGYVFAAWEINGVNETTTESAWSIILDENHTATAYFEVDSEAVFTLELVVNSPANTTYSTAYVPVSLTTTGNDTNPVYSWNFLFSDSSWLYESNQTSASASMTINQDTSGTFCCHVQGDFGTEDYVEVMLTVEGSDYNRVSSQLFAYAYLAFGLISIGFIVVAAFTVIHSLRNDPYSNPTGPLLFLVSSVIMLVVGFFIITSFQAAYFISNITMLL